MATSGSIDLVSTRDDIIQEALEQLGVVDSGQSPDPEDVISLARSLNYTIKWLQTKGLNLFALERIALMLEKNKRQYNLGPTGDHFTPESDLRRLTTTSSLLSGVTVIPVNDASQVLNGDEIGIVQSDGTAHWTTVAAPPVGDDVTITLATTSDVANSAPVFNFTSKSNRPMKIHEIVIRRFDDTDGGLDIPVEIIAREQYQYLSNKFSPGQANQAYYDPQVGTGILFPWPVADDVSEYLILYAQRTLEDVDIAADDIDFPQEWFLPIAMNLAKFNIAKFGVPRDNAATIKQQAKETLDDALGWDVEEGIRIQPDDRWRQDE